MDKFLIMELSMQIHVSTKQKTFGKLGFIKDDNMTFSRQVLLL
jgi:hypothetical protein